MDQSLIYLRYRADYGGMDVYVNQIVGNGQPHDYFYTNEKVLVSVYSITFVCQ